MKLNIGSYTRFPGHMLLSSVLLAGALTHTTFAAELTSNYAGQETRQIKSLSASDITALRSGAGWGLAKAAELNGVPGPAHLLEMKDHIGLNADQIAAISQVFDEMNARAVILGKTLIQQEMELNALFKKKQLDPNAIEVLVKDIGKTRSALRFAHLEAHLQTPAILTHQQIQQYNQLRGYGAKDPCESVPQGHDPVMWKKHNNCP